MSVVRGLIVLAVCISLLVPASAVAAKKDRGGGKSAVTCNLPESNADGENNHRTIKSRSGHVVRLNDKSGNETIEVIDKSGNNKIVIDTAKNSITILANSDITIESKTGKLTMQATGIEMKSRMGVTIEADMNMDLKANAQVSVKGAMIRIH